jgi:hypothetical protein
VVIQSMPWLVIRLVGKFVTWWVSQSVHWSFSRLEYQSVDQLVCWLVGQ